MIEVNYELRIEVSTCGRCIFILKGVANELSEMWN